MAKYLYTARNAVGRPMSGEIDAKDDRDVALQLRSKGLVVTSIERQKEKDEKKRVKILDWFSGISLKEKVFFTRNLSVMISSGLTVARAVSNLSAQTNNKRFRKILDAMYKDVQSGATFSAALARYPAIFNELFVNMVRVGEAGGTLDQSLDIITTQMEKDHELQSKVRGAMIYPAVIVCAMVVVGVIMLTYILPQILGVFADMEVELPATTRFVISVSDTLHRHGIAIALGFFVLVVGTKPFLGTRVGKRMIGFFTISCPGLRTIAIKVNVARFARIYSSLLRSGVSVTETLSIVGNTLSNVYFKDAVFAARDHVQKGVELSTVIAGYPKIFPVIVPQMIGVGEETGKTEEMMVKLADFYEEEIAQITKNLSSVIEPILMIVIGGAVGFFAVAMLTPMYSVLENIS